MKHKGNIRLFITILVFLAVSCKKETETVNVDLGYDYFPDDSGTFVVYKVDSTIYDDFTATVRKSTIYLKEVITKQFPDNLSQRRERLTATTVQHRQAAGSSVMLFIW